MRRDIRRQTEEFLSKGGEIKRHAPGESGDSVDRPRARPVFVNGEARQARTYLNDVVSALDDRKRKKQEKPAKKPKKRPKKKIIYDDFGEPLREVWIDE